MLLDVTMSWNANEPTMKLHRACIKGDLEIVNNLVANDKEKINVTKLDEIGTLLKTVGLVTT